MGIEDLKETQRVQGGMLQTLIRQNKVDSNVSLPQGATATFPLGTVEEFDAMEQKLADPAFASGLVSVYYCVMHSNCTKCIKCLI